ncbi:MAG: bifunctional pyr operon transcriptional regulator/uracil phosphoribosyltransferase PyrR [Bacteroidetes bacterium]|nr:bifunctional pyr operon transcriptional regulator/uracil phosphoribosyltransferase PyrR [Bacteroidota bacterium]
MQTILSSGELAEIIKVLAQSILKNHPVMSDVVLAGIQRGGAVVGAQIVAEIQKLNPEVNVKNGQLDITFYRDDIRNTILSPDPMNMPFDIENKTVILIDDVLFTGRTIKAALDTLLDYGRPAKVELCVLIDRKEHRQFPIQADYIGKSVTSTKSEKVKLIDNEVVIL